MRPTPPTPRTPAALLTLAALCAASSFARAQTPPQAPPSATDTRTLYLSGHDKDDAVPWDFTVSAGDNANRPSTIKVPSNWELQGFGTFTYGNEVRRSGVPQITGHYKHSFTVPANWSGQRVYLVFDGSMTDTTALVNGTQAGPTHQGGYYRFKYDVSKLVKYGQDNLLEVSVDQESADPTVNNAERRADYWNYAGIFRPVYLEAMPQDCITHVAINATADGKLSASLIGLNDAASNALNLTLDCQILDADGNPVGDLFHGKQMTVDAQGEWNATLSGSLPNPKTWSAETPNLYTLQLSLKDPSGKTIHTVKQPFGFRTIEIRSGEGVANPGLFVNGQRILLKGADRHSFWPDSGRCLSFQNMKDDIAIMKAMNMNAVRCSHYPPDAAFLDFCDQQGMYVLDELGGWHQHYGDEVGHKLVKEMVDRDVNHPSILFWDNGNEGGWNNNLNDDFDKYDPQNRHVLHPWELFRGVDTKHYPSFALHQQKLAGPNVYFPTEMIHGLFDGGAGADLEEYWNATMKSPYGAGGFIWALVDEGVKRPDTGQIDTRGNQAPDGILGPYRQKEGSFYTIKQLWSPIMLSVKSSEILPEPGTLPDNFDGTLKLENRYSFTNTSQCTFQWELRSFKGDPGYSVTAKGTTSADVKPLSTGALHIDLPANWQKSDALAVRASDPQGNELWTFVWPTANINEYRNLILGPTLTDNSPPPHEDVHETDDTLTISNRNTIFIFDKKNGRLASIQSLTGDKATFPLTNGPRVVALPHPPAPPRAARGAAEQPPAPTPVPDATLASFSHKSDGATETITATYANGPLKTVTWTVKPSGELDLDATYSLTGPHDYFGLGFDLKDNSPGKTDNIHSFRWLGNGPYRAYANRLSGGSLNVWQTAYNDTITGFRDWIYPEFKGYYANVKWAQIHTSAGPIIISLNQDDLYLQLLTPSLPPPPPANISGHAYVNYPSAGLSILNAIPPIGSKFNGPESGGELGKPPVATGDYHISAKFLFGKS
ncbi:MAG TPA: glycoside hydrolase family 2 TIM barrel-domain containing protein [Phycisphaerae bacterium]|nr:glycoside hydrolase family 2 TIM barrel-domain containing protein [Phycisphaerae bacterium]